MSFFIRALAAGASALVLFAGSVACRTPRTDPRPPDAAAPKRAASEVPAFRRAEDARRAADVLALLAEGAAADVRARRAAARALARIGDEVSEAELLRRLGDEDREVVAWAAYGLGYACKIQTERHVAALVARFVLAVPDAGAGGPDAAFAAARALGRCGTEVAERTLVGWLRGGGPLSEAAAYGLGDVAQKRALSAESVTALVDLAGGGPGRAPALAAFFPFTRMATLPEPFRDRIALAAQRGLETASELRVLAVRALAKAGAVEPLRAVASTASYSLAERVEAARGLGRAGAAGQEAALSVLERMTPHRAAAEGPEHHLLVALLEAAEGEAAREGRGGRVVYNLAALPDVAGDRPSTTRRLEAVRCRAAGVLARGDDDAEVIRRCGADGSDARLRATLKALSTGTLAGARLKRFDALLRSPKLKVREAALELLAAPRDYGEVFPSAIDAALRSKLPGVVATGADVVAKSAARLAAGTKSRAVVDAAMSAAAGEAWPEDALETKGALLEAAVALSHARAKDLALAACVDANVTLRQKGKQALAVLGDAEARCEAKGDVPIADEVATPLAAPVTLVFDVEGRELRVLLEPALAPIATTRLAALAGAGFFRGVVIHRVVPAFVVQLGDRGGDGYGGAGKLLRCETSPVPFRRFDVGMALAGRDTASSQFFVTLSRTPHLDGDYAHIGTASGDWDALSEGDVVGDVRVAK